MDGISLEQYQQSIALMNSDLNDIQADIQKLANQQNQIQAQTIQAQQLLQAQQIANILNQVILINGIWDFTIYWVSLGLSLMDDLITRSFPESSSFLFAFCRFFWDTL